MYKYVYDAGACRFLYNVDVEIISANICFGDLNPR